MARAALGKAIDVVGVGGQFWIFALGSDRQMIYKYWDGSAWQPSQTDWEPLGGNFVSPPSAAARNFTYTPAESHLDVVGVNSKGVLYHKHWDGSEWQPSQIGWDDLGALPAPFAHPPAITGLEGPHLVDIVATSKDGRAYHKYLDGGTWQPVGIWEALGGGIGRPAVAGLDIAAMKFSIFGISSGGRVAHKYWDGSAWQPSQTGWEDLGGNFANVAAVGMSSDIQFDVFGIGAVSGLFHKWFDVSNGWHPSPTAWETLTLSNDFNFLDGNPAVVQFGDPFNRVDVLVGEYGRVLHNYRGYFGGAWLPNWEVLTGNNYNFLCAPAADGVYPAPSTAILHIVCIGQVQNEQFHMMHKTFDSNGWHPSPTDWENLGYGLGNQGFMTLPPLAY